MVCISGVGCASFGLLVELLKAVLELGQVVNLTLQHLDRVNLLNALVASTPSNRSLLLMELPHLVLPTDNLMMGLLHPTKLVMLLSSHIV